jgi:putative transcriptional regulator
MNSFHPSNEQLIEYSAGSLAASISLCVAAHLSACELCRKQHEKLTVVAGFMFDRLETDDVDVDDGLLTGIFEKIDQRTASADSDVVAKNGQSSSLSKIIDPRSEALHWRTYGKNMQSAELLESDGIKASLVRIKAGAMIPMHSHKGMECTVVLEGSFSDAEGIYRPGDFIMRDASHEHAPVASADADCICLIALDAPLLFKSPVMKVYNHFFPL